MPLPNLDHLRDLSGRITPGPWEPFSDKWEEEQPDGSTREYYQHGVIGGVDGDGILTTRPAPTLMDAETDLDHDHIANVQAAALAPELLTEVIRLNETSQRLEQRHAEAIRQLEKQHAEAINDLNANQYEFRAKVAIRDQHQGRTFWDGAMPITVIADTRESACEKIRTIMGKPEIFREWAIRIREITPYKENTR